MDLKEALRYNYLLNGLNQEEFDKVAALAELKVFDGGQTIVRQFDRSSDVMVVIDGNVRVNTFHGDKIAEGGPGCVIGEISLIDEKPRSATVVSVGKVQIGVVPADQLWKLMQGDANLARKILYNISQVLCMRLRTANLHLDTLMGKLQNS